MTATARVAPRLPDTPRGIELNPADGLDDEEVIEGVAVRGDLAGCVADDVTLSECRLVGVRLTGARLARLRLRDCVLDTCDLSGAVVEQANWQRVELHDCRLTGTVLTQATWRHVGIQHCQANALALRVATVGHADLVDCLLRDADWSGTQLSDVLVDGCDLTELDVAHARLERVRFRASRLDGLRGVTSLGGATIDSPSIVPLAMSLFTALGVVVDDD